jgi:3-oxoacyl-[acyl-carrier protein] reductase
VEEIRKLGGDAIGVAGDVAADDFPKKIVDATIRYALPFILMMHLE